MECAINPTPPQIEFSQIYLSKPVWTEANGETAVLFPKEARLRNLTYAAPLCVAAAGRLLWEALLSEGGWRRPVAGQEALCCCRHTSL